MLFSSVAEISTVRKVSSPRPVSPSFGLTLVFDVYGIKVLQITCIVLLSHTLKFLWMKFHSSSGTASVIPEKMGEKNSTLTFSHLGRVEACTKIALSNFWWNYETYGCGIVCILICKYLLQQTFNLIWNFIGKQLYLPLPHVGVRNMSMYIYIYVPTYISDIYIHIHINTTSNTPYLKEILGKKVATCKGMPFYFAERKSL